MYEGSVYDKESNGFGRVILADEGYYIGEFENGLVQGYGKWNYPDGTVKEGFWEND